MKLRKPKDRHLDIPAEANRDKHINFTALENDQPDPADQKNVNDKTSMSVVYQRRKRK
jgi:hypothetical protein